MDEFDLLTSMAHVRSSSLSNEDQTSIKRLGMCRLRLLVQQLIDFFGMVLMYHYFSAGMLLCAEAYHFFGYMEDVSFFLGWVHCAKQSFKFKTIFKYVLVQVLTLRAKSSLLRACRPPPPPDCLFLVTIVKVRKIAVYDLQ